jgi:hypothetical protein
VSSGFARLFHRLTGRARDRDRLTSLAARGLTVELAALDASSGENPVVMIDLGFGNEFWLVVGEPVALSADASAVERGRLIVSGGTKVTSERALRERGVRARHVLTRF